MQFSNTKTYNFEGSIRGMRNPMNSWDKSDSLFGIVDIYDSDALTDVCDAWIEFENQKRIKNNLEPYSYDMEESHKYYEILHQCNKWLMSNGILSANDNYEGLYDVAFLGPNDLTGRISGINYWPNRVNCSRWFGTFTLVTPDGTRYTFGGVDATDFSIDYYARASSDLVATAWHLARIITPQGREITFSYATEDHPRVC